MIIIKRVTFRSIHSEPNFDDLVKENAEESRINGMPPINVQPEIYYKLNESGMLHFFGAYQGSVLVGLLSVIIPVLPHYGVLTAMSESFFVFKAYRKTGAGLKLLKIGELFSKKLGSPGFFLSAPSKSILSKILPKRGYVETNRVFFKSWL